MNKVYTGTTTIEEHIKQLGSLYEKREPKVTPPRKELTRAEIELHDMRLILEAGKD